MTSATLDKAIRYVAALGVLAVLGIIGLSGLERTVPDVLQNVAVGSMTGLIGLLVQTREPDAPKRPLRAADGRG